MSADSHRYELTWCEVDRSALRHNASLLRDLVGEGVLLACVVKGNAYGHGTSVAAEAFVEGGADWLAVHSIEEAEQLRAANLRLPVYVLGYVPLAAMERAAELDLRLVVYNSESVDAAARAGRRVGRPLRLHVKLETGNHRQGLGADASLDLAARIASLDGVALEGLATHFADVEDTTDHRYAGGQLERLRAFVEQADARGVRFPIVHCANSAATILWPHSHEDLVRAGIASYGMWPSTETYVTALLTSRHTLDLRPALTWKTRIVQVKDVPAGSDIGYGRTFRTTHDSRIAVIGVGYYDGYDRRLSNQAHVLIRGHRAPVRGRVAMNLVTVDVTDVPGVGLEDEVVLLGRSGGDTLSAEQMAGWIGTINYEVTTRIHERTPRIPV